MPWSAIGAIASSYARLTVAMASHLVTLIANAAIDIAQARLARNTLTGIAIIAIIAFLTFITAEATRTRAALGTIAQELAGIGKIAIDGRARARPAAARVIGFTVIAFGALLAMISGSALSTIGTSPSLPIACLAPPITMARISLAHQFDKDYAGHMFVFKAAIIAAMRVLARASSIF